MKRIILFVFLILISFLINAQQATKVSHTTFTDPRDNKTYKIVVIGTQTWMAENLNFKTDTGSWCYNNDTSHCNTYGRLYNWATAQTICPSGWHLPADEEWTVLTEFIGTDAGKKIKTQSGWENKGNGTDNLGFAAIPGGCFDSSNNFTNLGYYAYWWSSTEKMPFNAWSRNQCTFENRVGRYVSYKKSGFSVRCLKNY